MMRGGRSGVGAAVPSIAVLDVDRLRGAGKAARRGVLCFPRAQLTIVFLCHRGTLPSAQAS